MKQAAMEVESNEENTYYPYLKRWKLILNVILCILTLLLTGFHCIARIVKYHYLFSWHVILGTISYVFLLPSAIMIFDDIFLQKYSRKLKSKIHGITIGIAIVLAIISTALEYYRKETIMSKYPDVTHFETTHAITGLLSIILFLVASISGLFTYNSTWFKENILSVRPVVLKLCHNVMGQIGYTIGMICIISVMFQSWFLYHYTMFWAVVLAILTGILTVGSLVNSFISGYNQIQPLLTD